MISYFEVLIYFIIIPIIIFTILNYSNFKNDNYLKYPKEIILLLIIIALVYTTPWDNYLVYSGVWFYDENLVSNIVIFYVPLEEYFFFILETLLVSLLNYYVIHKIHNRKKLEKSLVEKIDDNFIFYKNKNQVIIITMILFAIWILSLFLFIFSGKQFDYITLILLWAIPPICLQILFGLDILIKNYKILLLNISICTLYLSIIDGIAIYYGTWTIAEETSLNLLIFGILPIEEFLFFLVTVILVSFGFILGTSPEMHEKLKNYKSTNVI